MKYLDAKRAKGAISNKMAPGPSADKSEPSTSERAPAVSGSQSTGNRGPDYDATPAAARLAEESGVDLAFIAGTGVGGRITVPDVEAAIEATKANQSSTSIVSDVEQES